ncbi:hypothetical protein RFI_37357, partial [Reticulomyxa filosa]
QQYILKQKEITLSALTMKSFTTTMQRLWFSQERKSESESKIKDDQEHMLEITDKNNMKVEKNEDIQRNHIMMNPLALLAGAIRYETSGKKLTSVNCDMIQLKRLFAKIFFIHINQF